jgi:hypothetical protein
MPKYREAAGKILCDGEKYMSGGISSTIDPKEKDM